MTTSEKGKAWLLAWLGFLSPPALVYGAVFFWWAPAFLPPHKRLFDVESDVAFGAMLTVAHIALTLALYHGYGAAKQITPSVRARSRPLALSARGFLTRGHSAAGDSVERYREKVREQWDKYL